MVPSTWEQDTEALPFKSIVVSRTRQRDKRSHRCAGNKTPEHALRVIQSAAESEIGPRLYFFAMHQVWHALAVALAAQAWRLVRRWCRRCRCLLTRSIRAAILSRNPPAAGSLLPLGGGLPHASPHLFFGRRSAVTSSVFFFSILFLLFFSRRSLSLFHFVTTGISSPSLSLSVLRFSSSAHASLVYVCSQ